MPVLIHDEELSKTLIEERQASGLDRYDEVWNGVYVMSPLANIEHQDLVMAFSGTLMQVWDLRGLGRTQPGANVSDRRDDWRNNYRIPDVLCFTNDCSAEDCNSHWFGGPEFAIEITSPGERAFEKLDFYARVGTREVLIVERRPWKLSLYRTNRNGSGMRCVANNDGDSSEWIASDIVPVKFLLDVAASQIRIADDRNGVLREIPIKT